MSDEGKLLLIRGRRNKLLLGATAAVVLGVGSVAGPRGDAAQPTIAVPPEPVAPLLQPAMQDSALRLRALRDAGTTAMAHVVSVSLLSEAAPHAGGRSQADVPRADPAPLMVAGVVVGPSRVLTVGLEFADAVLRGGARVEAAGGATFSAHLERCDPSSGLVTLQVAGGDTLAAAVVGRAPAPWTTAVAVTRLRAAPVLSPVWIAGVDHATVRLGLGPAAAGAGIFDDKSRLVAIAAGGEAAWTAAGALARVDSMPVGIPTVLGWTLQQITDDLRPLVPATGVLIAGLQDGGPAAAAGVLPGDVVTHIGGDPVVSPRDLMVALSSRSAAGEVALRLRRGSEDRTLVARPRAACSPGDAGQRAAAGPRAGQLFAAAALQSAGLPPDAIVLDVDGRLPAAAIRGRPSRPALVRAREAGRPPAFYAVAR